MSYRALSVPQMRQKSVQDGTFGQKVQDGEICRQPPSTSCSKPAFVRGVHSVRKRRDVIMSFIMNSEGNKEFKENSGDSQRAKPFSLPELPWRRRIADQTLVGS